MQPEELDIAIEELELRLERLRALYEQYFLGIEKMEPAVPRKDVDRRIYALRREKIRNTGKRFKLQTLIQRYNTFQQHWQRVCREIENGTYRRHLLKAERTVGPTELLTASARRRFGAQRRKSDPAAAAPELPAMPAMPVAEETTIRDYRPSLLPPGSEMPDVPRSGASAQPNLSAPRIAGRPSNPLPPRDVDAAFAPPVAPPRAESGRQRPPPPPARAPMPTPPLPLPPPRVEMRAASPERPAARKVPSVTPALGTPTARDAQRPPLDSLHLEMDFGDKRAPAEPARPPPRPVPSASLPAGARPAPPPKPIRAIPPAPSAAQTAPRTEQGTTPAGGFRAAGPAPVGPAPAAPARAAPTPATPTRAPAPAAPTRAPAPPERVARPRPEHIPLPSPRASVEPARPPAAAPKPAASPARSAEAARPAGEAAARTAQRREGPPAQASGSTTLTEQRLRELHGRFNEAGKGANQPAVSLDGLARSLKAAEAKLRAQHGNRRIEFDIVLKDGKPAIKPTVR